MAPAAENKFLVHQKKFVSEVQEQNDRNNINFCGGSGTTLKWRSIGSHLNGSWKEFFFLTAVLKTQKKMMITRWRWVEPYCSRICLPLKWLHSRVSEWGRFWARGDFEEPSPRSEANIKLVRLRMRVEQKQWGLSSSSLSLQFHVAINPYHLFS